MPSPPRVTWICSAEIREHVGVRALADRHGPVPSLTLVTRTRSAEIREHVGVRALADRHGPVPSLPLVIIIMDISMAHDP